MEEFLLLIKLQVSKSNTPPGCFSSFLKLYKWCHIAQSITSHFYNFVSKLIRNFCFLSYMVRFSSRNYATNETLPNVFNFSLTDYVAITNTYRQFYLKIPKRIQFYQKHQIWTTEIQYILSQSSLSYYQYPLDKFFSEQRLMLPESTF